MKILMVLSLQKATLKFAWDNISLQAEKLYTLSSLKLKPIFLESPPVILPFV